MARRWNLCLLLFLAACQTTDGADEDPWQPVRFLAGGWGAESADGSSEEVWSPPYGDTMYGQSRTVRDGELRSFELLTIERRDDALVYVARPHGGDATEFPATGSGTDSVTFANVEHDFPKRLHYWLDEAGALRATADDGTDDGQRLEFRWLPIR